MCWVLVYTQGDYPIYQALSLLCQAYRRGEHCLTICTCWISRMIVDPAKIPLTGYLNYPYLLDIEGVRSLWSLRDDGSDRGPWPGPSSLARFCTSKDSLFLLDGVDSTGKDPLQLKTKKLNTSN